MADEIIDTSDLTVHELRQQLLRARPRPQAGAKLMLTFESFGFKHGVPLEADLVFDCRFLPNPHFVPACGRRPGKDPAVAAYMRRQPADARSCIKRLTSLLPASCRTTSRRQELPDGRDRLHRRPPSIGVSRRNAQARARRRSSASPRACAHRDLARGAAMIGVVVVTHGQLATELVNAAETIVGDLPHFTAVSIGWHEDVQDARDEIAAAIARVRHRRAC